VSAITVSRTRGSGGTEVARMVAEALGWHLANKLTIARVLSQYGLISFAAEYEVGPGFWARFMSRVDGRSDVMHNLDAATKALAHHGDIVILGRGAFAALSGFADVLHVRIQAPITYRTTKVMEAEGIEDAATARGILEASDSRRSGFVHSAYGVGTDTASLFNLVIDAEIVGPEIAAAWIVQAAGVLRDNGRDGRPTAGAIEVSPGLSLSVSKQLGCEVRHG